jgi:hypothetical protein
MLREEDEMSTSLSVAEILATLEKQIEHHRERAAFHAQQEVHHREQSALHLAEMEKISQHFEAFKATALPAADLARQVGAPSPAREEADDLLDFVGKKLKVSRLVMRAVERLQEPTFGAAQVAAEVNRRYGDKLRRPVDNREVSTTLRRLRDSGRLRVVRQGKAVHGALYAKP